MRFLSLFLFLPFLTLAQTTGTLTFNVTTIAHSGFSGTQNVLAIWIQSSTGGFIKTHFRYAGGGTSDHLPTWSVNAGGTAGNCLSASCNVVGATTGATLNGAVTKTVTWNGTNAAGAPVADGTYKVTIQETWNHGSSGTVTRSFTFVKGPNQDIQTPATDANFTNLSLQWIPDVPVVPTASFTAPSLLCSGQAFTLTSTSTGSPTSYSWTLPGASNTSSTLQNPSVTFLNPGTYSVSLVASNAVGSSTPTTQTITVLETPSITATLGDTICSGTSAQLSANASVGVMAWYANVTGGVVLGSGNNFNTPTLTTNTTYYVGANNNGCACPRSAVLAVVNPTPIISAIQAAERCGAGTLNLTATANIGILSWFDSPVSTTVLGTGNTFTTPTISSTTTYYVESNANNCITDRSPVLATINAIPTVTMASLDTICFGTPSFLLTGGTPAGGTFSGLGVSNGQFDPASVGMGSYTITYSYSQNNCSASDSTQLLIDACVGLSDLQLIGIEIYPNPANDVLNLKGTSLKKYSHFQLYNMAGQLQSEDKLNNTKTISVKHLPNGTYLLVLSGSGQNARLEVQVQH